MPRNVAAKLALFGSVSLVAVLAVGWALTGNAGGKAHNGVSLHVLRSYTAHRIENAYLPATANGVYLIMDVSATNGASHVVALTSLELKLDLGGARYQPDAHGLSALELSGHGLLTATNLAPASTASGWLVFDVPPAAATATPQLCLSQPQPANAPNPAC